MDVSYDVTNGYSPGYKALITFKNITKDTLWLTKVVPFGFSKDEICIVGKGDHSLSRSYLFRPGFEPVNCILPDNAWELGFSDFAVKDGQRIAALTRRLRVEVISIPPPVGGMCREARGSCITDNFCCVSHKGLKEMERWDSGV
jgi:hypothetical protein